MEDVTPSQEDEGEPPVLFTETLFVSKCFLSNKPSNNDLSSNFELEGSGGSSQSRFLVSERLEGSRRNSGASNLERPSGTKFSMMAVLS